MRRRYYERMRRHEAKHVTAHKVCSAKGRQSQKWFSLYLIQPPVVTPYLPSDEALRAACARFRDLRFRKTMRYPDRDLLEIHTYKRNFFNQDDPSSHSVRADFFRTIERMALAKRFVPDYVRERSSEILATDAGITTIIWNGKSFAYKGESSKLRPVTDLSLELQAIFRELGRECVGILPFKLKAASS